MTLEFKQRQETGVAEVQVWNSEGKVTQIAVVAFDPANRVALSISTVGYHIRWRFIIYALVYV